MTMCKKGDRLSHIKRACFLLQAKEQVYLETCDTQKSLRRFIKKYIPDVRTIIS